MRTIILEQHNSDWSNSFQREIALIKPVFLENYAAAYHIGSTAIPSICAKPVIDILIAVRSIDRIDKYPPQLEKALYRAKGEYGLKGRRFFQKGNEVITHHLHIFESGHSEIERHRLFVEFMKVHPDKAADYERLKIKLARKYKNQPDQYSQSKSTFIHAIDLEASAWKKQ